MMQAAESTASSGRLASATSARQRRCCRERPGQGVSQTAPLCKADAKTAQPKWLKKTPKNLAPETGRTEYHGARSGKLCHQRGQLYASVGLACMRDSGMPCNAQPTKIICCKRHSGAAKPFQKWKADILTALHRCCEIRCNRRLHMANLTPA